MAKKPLGEKMAAELRQAIGASGLSLNQLGQKAGIDHSRLSRFVRGERDLTLDTVSKLCEVLGLHLCRDDETQPQGGEPAAQELPPGRPRKAAEGEQPSRRAGKDSTPAEDLETAIKDKVVDLDRPAGQADKPAGKQPRSKASGQGGKENPTGKKGRKKA